jgi:hypothetical protein
MLDAVPGLSSTIGMEKAMTSVRLATQLKDEILLKQKVGHDANKPPNLLPENVQEFLGCAIDLPDKYVHGCWTAFRQTIWQWGINKDSTGADAKLFKEHGLQGLLCESVIYPVIGCLLI